MTERGKKYGGRSRTSRVTKMQRKEERRKKGWMNNKRDIMQR